MMNPKLQVSHEGEFFLLKDEESARDNHVLAYNFAKYSPILTFSLSDSAITIS